MLRTALIPSANAIPASGSAGTVLLDLPIGKRYHMVGLTLADGLNATALASMIGEIRVKINGKTQRQFTPAQLSGINSLMGSAFANTTKGTTTNTRYLIPLMFAEPFRKDVNQVSIPGWNVAGPDVRSFQIEIDWLANASDAKSVKGYYEWEPATAALGVITKMTRVSLAAAGTSQDFNLLGLIPNDSFLQSISMFTPTTSSPIKAQLVLNGEIVHDNLEFWENFAHLQFREMNPDTTTTNPRYDIVLDYDDPIVNAVKMQGINEAKLHVEYGTVNTTTGAVAGGTATGVMPVLITHVGKAI